MTYLLSANRCTKNAVLVLLLACSGLASANVIKWHNPSFYLISSESSQEVVQNDPAQAQIKALSKTNADLKSSFQSRLTQAKLNTEQLRQQNLALTKELNQQRSIVQRQKQELDQLAAKATLNSTTIQTLEQKNKALTDAQVNTVAQTNADLASSLQGRLAQAKLDSDQLRRQNTTLTDELAQSNKKLESCVANRTQLESRIVDVIDSCQDSTIEQVPTDYVALDPQEIQTKINAADRYLEQQEFELAFALYQELSELGFLAATLNLANLYYIGKGIERDFTQAHKLYTELAEQGVSQAQYVLSIMYKMGQGVDQDDTQAAYWLTKSKEDTSNNPLKEGQEYILPLN